MNCLFNYETKSEWAKPLREKLAYQKSTETKIHNDKNDDGAERAAKSGSDLTCLRPAQSMDSVLHGTTSLLKNGLHQSMEDEFKGTEYWEEYDYVVHQPAKEGGPNVKSQEKAMTPTDFSRDKGHDGWSLQDFVNHDRSKQAHLTHAEVAAMRLFTSPWFAAVNRALRKKENVTAWATSISVLISGLMKVAALNEPRPLYRALKGKLADGAIVGSTHIDPAVLGCSSDPGVAVMYSGNSNVSAVILCIESTFASRAGLIGDIGQVPDEVEWILPPYTALEILEIEQFDRKTLVRVSPTLSFMRHYTHNLRYPWTSPNDPLTWEEYDMLEEAIQKGSMESSSRHVRETKFSSDARDFITGAPKIAALGLEAYMEQSMALPPDGVSMIEKEFKKHGTESDQKWFHYIMYEPASRVEDDWGVRDENRDGMSLESFHDHSNAKIAGLTLAHVLALRLYTCRIFLSLNNPLRKFKLDENGNFKQPLSMAAPHNFPVTIAFIDDGIRRLRAVEADRIGKSGGRSEEIILWRGMSNVQATEEFLRCGGVEVAPMSTTYSLQTAVRYAMKGDANTIFRIITRSFMDRGANIEFLSTYPKEEEYLYPPLTFLSPTGRSQQVGSFNVIELVLRL